MDPTAWMENSPESDMNTAPTDTTNKQTNNQTNSTSKDNEPSTSDPLPCRNVSVNSFEFPSHTENATPDLDRASRLKRFLIKLKTGNEVSMETCITIDKNFLGDVFEKVVKKYHIKKNLEDLVLYYPIRVSNGGTREVAVMNDEFAAENIETFYLQTPEMSSLTVEQVSQVNESRPKTPAEILYSTTIGKYFSVDKKFYELLVSHKSLTDKFFLRRKYLSVVMGRKCQNLLNPAHFICHIRGCESVLVLGAFSKLTLIKRHWKDHCIKEDLGKESCSNLFRRITYLEKKCKGDVVVAGRDVENVVDELEQAEFEGVSLKIVPGNHLYIEEGTKFSSRHLLIDHNVLSKILDGNPQALDDIPKTISVRSFAGRKRSDFFQRRKRLSSSSASVPTSGTSDVEEVSISGTPHVEEVPTQSTPDVEEVHIQITSEAPSDEVVEEEVTIPLKKSRKKVFFYDEDDGEEVDV